MVMMGRLIFLDLLVCLLFCGCGFAFGYLLELKEIVSF